MRWIDIKLKVIYLLPNFQLWVSVNLSNRVCTVESTLSCRQDYCKGSDNHCNSLTICCLFPQAHGNQPVCFWHTLSFYFYVFSPPCPLLHSDPHYWTTGHPGTLFSPHPIVCTLPCLHISSVSPKCPDWLTQLPISSYRTFPGYCQWWSSSYDRITPYHTNMSLTVYEIILYVIINYD